MKKVRLQLKRVALYAIVLLYLWGANACMNQAHSDTEETHDLAVSLQEKTDKLVIFRPPLMADLTDAAVQTFREKFPEVEVEYVSFGDMMEEQSQTNYRSVLMNDISAGKGPDVILWSWEFTDIFKVILTDVFENIDPYMSQDPEFSSQDYVEGVMNGGVFQGRRWIVPLYYSVGFLVSTEKALADSGFPLIKDPSFSQWYEAILSQEENMKKRNCTFSNMYGAQNDLTMVGRTGISVLDYANGQSLARDEAFQQAMEINKLLYTQAKESYEPGWWDTWSPLPGDDVLSVRDGEILFAYADSPGSWLELYSGFLDVDTPVCYPFLSLNTGGGIAEIQQSAAIRKNSKNQVNAYEFIKILLSQSVQSAGNPYYRYYPIRKESLISVMTESAKLAVRCSVRDDSVIFQPIVQETMEQLIYMAQNVKSAPNSNQLATEFVMQHMQPFFKGDKTYESCLESLVNTLELYVLE